MVDIGKTLYVDSREKWRRWLQKNHDRVTEIWLLYAKKASGKKRVTYADAVEEALCFGWIDGVYKPVDEHFYAQRFSPRKPRSTWSRLNRERYKRLLKEGKVAPAGLAKPPDNKTAPVTPKEFGDKIPAYIRKAMRDNDVWTAFQKMPPGRRRMCAFWIDYAKREETRKKRLQTIIDKLKEKQLEQWLRGK